MAAEGHEVIRKTSGYIITRVRLSVILPTTQAWPEIEQSLATSLHQHSAETYEVLVLDGHGDGLKGEPAPPVRWIREPGADVFRLRALGIAAALGELIVFSEDHCLAEPDWLERTSVAHRSTTAHVLIGPVRNHPESSQHAIDRATFALTLGALALPLDEVPGWRLPVPTNLSIKRGVLPDNPPPAGWIEYDFLAAAMRDGSVAVARDAALFHLQRWDVSNALTVHFQSGRSYGASVRQWPPAARSAWWRALPAVPHMLYKRTLPVLLCGAAGANAARADRFWLGSLVLANVMGQIAGAMTGAGSSRHWLR